MTYTSTTAPRSNYTVAVPAGKVLCPACGRWAVSARVMAALGQCVHCNDRKNCDARLGMWA